MIHRFFGPFFSGRPALGMLIIRMIFGVGLAYHGWGKIQNPFHWMDKMPGAAPAFFQLLAAISEFGGGLALIVGLLTPLACLGIICTMLTAAHAVPLPEGKSYLNLTASPGYELVGHYLAVALGVLIAGPGALSLDALLFGRRRGDGSTARGTLN